ncbi:MAG TPA: twin-arginine translocase TatA/TatE family subunit [Pseudolysinimonas sp.]|nr:twin-arginine translocase TatA/TatE family subunit [Pseudolysinimonas sp.]
MLRGLFDGPGIWIVLVVVLLLFGATRLPALAKSIGQSTKIFRNEMKSDQIDPDPSAVATPQAPAAPMSAAEPVAPAVDQAAPKKSAKSAKTSGASGKTAKS